MRNAQTQLATAGIICTPAAQPKHCGCGLAHDSDAWSNLPYLGVMGDEADAFELRNCPCGSTLAVEVEV